MYITSCISLPSLLKDFSELKDPVAFPDSIRKPEISIEGAQHKQEVFNRYQKEKKKKKINKHFNRRHGTIKLADDYGSMILETKRKAYEEEPKTRTNKDKNILNSMKNL